MMSSAIFKLKCITYNKEILSTFKDLVTTTNITTVNFLKVSLYLNILPPKRQNTGKTKLTAHLHQQDFNPHPHSITFKALINFIDQKIINIFSNKGTFNEAVNI